MKIEFELLKQISSCSVLYKSGVSKKRYFSYCGIFILLLSFPNSFWITRKESKAHKSYYLGVPSKANHTLVSCDLSGFLVIDENTAPAYFQNKIEDKKQSWVVESIYLHL